MTVEAISPSRAERPARVTAEQVAAAALVMLSLAIFAVSMRYGIGIMVDSTRYFGLSPQPYDAPAYPFLLRSLAGFGLSLTQAATVVAVILVPVNTLLVWKILIGTTRRLAPSVIGTLLVILNPPYAAYHATAMSEPPFIALILATVMFAGRYQRDGGRSWLIAAAVALGCASLVRFTAPPLGAALALAMLVDGRRPLGRRFADVALFGAVSAAIFLGWVGYSLATTGHGTGRPMEWLGNLDAGRWMLTLDAFTALVLPTAVPLAIRATAFALVLVTGAAAVFRALRPDPGADDADRTARFLVLSLSLFTLLYVGFLVLATLIEANLTINGRYLLPGAVTGVLALTIAVARLPGTWARRAFAVAAAVILIGNAARTADAAVDAFRRGVGYNAVAWVDSPTLAAVADLPANALVASNGPDAIAYRVGREVRFAPSLYDRRTGLVRQGQSAAEQLDDLRRQAAIRPTYVVYFDTVDWRFYLVPEAEVVSALGLQLLARTADGRLYAIPGAAGLPPPAGPTSGREPAP